MRRIDLLQRGRNWAAGIAAQLACIPRSVKGLVLGTVGLAVLSGCTLVDSTLPMRGYGVNVNSGSLREDLILLNIVRASRFEPMNFVSLSKYNASGLLEAGGSMTRNNDFNVFSKGGSNPTSVVIKSIFQPNAKVNTAANFDLVPLENKEFYAGLLAQIDLATINLLVNAGLSRELVLHALVKTVRIQHKNGQWFHFHNDPSNDGWQGDYKQGGQRQCEQLFADGAFDEPFIHSAWKGPHTNDCNYQKFLHFLRGAIRYGLTAEVVEPGQASAADGKAKGAASAKSATAAKGGGAAKGAAPADKDDASAAKGGEAGAVAKGGTTVTADGAATITTSTTQVVVNTGTADKAGGAKAKVMLCYDAAIAQEYGRKVAAGAACGSRNAATGQLSQPHQALNLLQVQPFLRSPYSVFQYFGQILATNSAKRVKLIDANTPRLPTGDHLILTVNKGRDLDGCFANAHHAGETYCVPSEGANNTKEMFVLLNTLVNLSTTRSSLPTTPTVQIAP